MSFVLWYHFLDLFGDYSSEALSFSLKAIVSFVFFNLYRFTSILLYFLIGASLKRILLVLIKALILYPFAFEKELYFYEASIIIPLSFAIIILTHFWYQNFVSNFLTFAGLF